VAANPSHEDNGGFLPDSALELEMKEAIERPEKYAGYVRLNLNVPCALTGTPVINMPLWCEGGGGVDLREWPEYDIELLIRKWPGQPILLRGHRYGLDHGHGCARSDMAALALMFPPESEGEQWKTLMFFWLPAARIPHIERRTRAPLGSWVKRGFLTTTPGAEVDLSVMIAKVEWASRMFDVREVTFDKWGGIKAVANLTLVPQGFVCVEIPQTIGGLTVSTKKFLGLYMSRQIAHANNPILNWNASCLSLQTDGGDNCKPVKPARDTASKRIDGVAAMITAGARAFLLEDNRIAYMGGFAQ
jgi:phage terminase large subunit-like protein